MKLTQVTSKIQISHTSVSSNSGFTLIELSVYMGLLSIFLFLLSGLFVSTLQVQDKSIDTARIEQDSHFIYARMQYDVGKSDELLLPASNGDISGVLSMSQGSNTITYSLNNGDLLINDGVGSSVLNSPDTKFSNLNFQRIGNVGGIPTVEVDAELESIENSNSEPSTKKLKFILGFR